jgi:hypothetical protein
MSKFKNIDNLYKGLMLNSKKQDLQTYNVENHYYFIQESKKYDNKGVAVNFTSNKNLKVIVKDEFGKESHDTIVLEKEFKPNLLGQDKSNFLTPPHIIDKNNSTIKLLEKDIFMQMQNYKYDAFCQLLDNKDEQLLHSVNKTMYKNEDALTLKE